MSKREHRRFTAERKLEILREADQPGVTVSEVRRMPAGQDDFLRRSQRIRIISILFPVFATKETADCFGPMDFLFVNAISV